MFYPPKKPLRLSDGFTLIEILVSLVIIGVIVGSATIMFGDPGKDEFSDERDRVITLIELAKEEAILQSRDYGIGFWEAGYTFYEYTGLVDQAGKPAWFELKDDLLRAREVTEGLELQLTLEGLDIVMSAVAIEKPQVFLLSSGEVTPFSLTMEYERRFRATVTFDALGNAEVSEVEEIK